MLTQRWSAHRVLIGVAIAMALAVAALGGVRSFEAVSARFGSPLVPLTADGMIVACTALRLAALTRGWRLPGSLVTTYVFIVGTIWLNVAAAHGWSDAVAHALAPAAYAVLVELLAHMLRLQLRLSRPRQVRLSALTWATSPVITTRVWLHLARTGGEDPVAARALVQQVVRMRSRLRSVCPNGWHPFDGARPARTAALHTIRDGLLTAAEVAALLPASDRLTPAELLARIDRAALDTGPHRDAAPVTAAPADRGRCGPGPGVPVPDRTAEGAPVRPVNPTSPDSAVTGPTPAPEHATEPTPVPRRPVSASRSQRPSDEDLVDELRRQSAEHNGGRPLSGREVRRVLGVGTPKARRLRELAGWTTDAAGSGAKAETGESEPSKSDREAETEPQQLEMSDAR